MRKSEFKYCMFIGVSILALSPVAVAGPQPNIVVFLADDMGFSDIQPFGSEIKTPTLQALADQGLRMSQFYAGPLCGPTRSMFMSGVDNHLAGMGRQVGWAPNQKGQPGYEQYLNFRVSSVAQSVKDAGYDTLMVGKWHLGHDAKTVPRARGFDQTFILSHGTASHFEDMTRPFITSPVADYFENGKKLEALPKGFYSTRTYTDKALHYLKNRPDQSKPFFAYIAYTAPHDPLHIPKDWASLYQGRYDSGYDVLRSERDTAVKNLGIVAPETALAERLKTNKPWNSLMAEAQKSSARRMEIYADMISFMDTQIGRVVQYLKDRGQYDNTVIVFLSDNGASANPTIKYSSRRRPVEGTKWYNQTYDNRYKNLGKIGSAVAIGPGWAQATMAPYRATKGTLFEGGIHVPFLVSGPGINKSGAIDHQTVAHITDLTATIYDLARVKTAAKTPLQGTSLRAVWAGQRQSWRTKTYGWENNGHRAIRHGAWKLVDAARDGKGWMLFDLSSDASERHDVSAMHPDKVKALLQKWDAYQATNGVIMAPSKP